MKYRGTIAYRAGLGGNVPEGFAASLVMAWDFLIDQSTTHRDIVGDGPIGQCIYSVPRYHFMRGLSCMLHDSANQIADGFLGDWVLFLDTDHICKSDGFYEMVTTLEEGLPDGSPIDILAGFTQKRQPPYLPIMMKTNFDPRENFEPIIPGPIERHTLIPIDATGLGCVIVRRHVFDAIRDTLGERPFDFRSEFNPWTKLASPPPGVWNGWPKHVPDDSYPLSERHHWNDFYWEDISFFWRAKLLGFQAYCAPWIKFHHIETRLVTDDMMQHPLTDFKIPR